jgi:Tol biopolymer transport system component/DNA-binding winged helix-turn-helix (wHTH) protein
MAIGSVRKKHGYRFDSYWIDLDIFCLFRNGESVPLPPKEFELLQILVERCGQTVTREELISRLWPDTIVEEANLNVHISALRKVLGESPNSHQYIQTLPRRGYRFVAEVFENCELESASVAVSSPIPQVVSSETPEPRALPSASSVSPQKRWLARLKWPLVILAVGLIGVLALRYFNFFIPASSESWSNVIPLTTYPGRESFPALSPDGRHIAFIWEGEKDENSDIYVRLVEDSNPVRVTNSPAEDLNPVWSPDGQTLAFYRHAPETDGLYLVPALGGAERKLTTVYANRFNFGQHTWLDWSPDGKWLVITDKSSSQEPFSLYLLAPELGEKRQLTTPPDSIIGDCSPAFSPDGKMLAFVRVISASVGDVYLVPTNGGEATRLTIDNQCINDLTWAPDGRQIIFSSRRGGINRLWQIPISGGALQWFSPAGNQARKPNFSQNGKAMAWMQSTDNIDVWRVELKPKASPTVISANDPSPVIASTLADSSPAYSPDGKRIAFVSNRSGSNEIWVSQYDGSAPLQLTSFQGPQAGSPRWSPDGKSIVFDSRPDGNADIFTINSEGGRSRRLTTESSEDIVPTWSRDGQYIYFNSNRGGSSQIWKMPAIGGAAKQVTRNGGFECAESADGQWLYYTRERGVASIWRIPAAGGEEVPVFDYRPNGYSRMWTLRNGGVYFARGESSVRTAICFFNFSTRQELPVFMTQHPLPVGNAGLTLSPDERFLMFPVIAQRGSDLMFIKRGL